MGETEAAARCHPLVILASGELWVDCAPGVMGWQALYLRP